MAFDPIQVRAEMMAALKTVDGLRVYGARPRSPLTPCALIGWFDVISLRRAMGPINVAAMSSPLEVQILAARLDDEAGVQRLYELMIASIEAIEFDPTLNGAVGSINCTEIRNVGPIVTDDGSEFIGLTIECSLIK